MGHDYGQIAAQLKSFDAFYTVAPVPGFDVIGITEPLPADPAPVGDVALPNDASMAVTETVAEEHDISALEAAELGNLDSLTLTESPDEGSIFFGVEEPPAESAEVGLDIEEE